MRVFWGRRGVRALAAVSVLVAACGPVPKPFMPPPDHAANPLITEAAASGVWVGPVDGTTLPMSKLLSEAVAEGFKLYGVRATTDESRNVRYRLRGRAEINDLDPSVPYVVVVHWTLYDFDGKAVGAGTQGVPGSRRDWEYGSPAIIAEVGENAPEIIAPMIDKEDEDLMPVAPTRAGLWVNAVDGAPGDGGRSLTDAIRRAIEDAGMALAPDRGHAEFVLGGRVRLDAPEDGLQKVEIVWTVETQDGREIGRATQRNMVEAGTFDGAWGAVADLVAGAAMEGIQGVLRAASAPRFRDSRPARVLKTELPTDRDGIVLPPPTLEVDGAPVAPNTP